MLWLWPSWPSTRKKGGQVSMDISVVEVLSRGEQVSAVCCERGWYVVNEIPDASRDRLEDLPIAAGPFMTLEAARAWWLGGYMGKEVGR